MRDHRLAKRLRTIEQPRQEEGGGDDGEVQRDGERQPWTERSDARIAAEQAAMHRLRAVGHRAVSSFSGSVIIPSDSTPALRAVAITCTTSPYGSERSAWR